MNPPEIFIGAWAEARGFRHQLFMATKVRILLNATDDYPFYALMFLSVYCQLLMPLSPKKYSLLAIVGLGHQPR